MSVIPQPLVHVLAGYYTTLILDALHRNGVLAELAAGSTPAQVATERGLAPTVLEGVLEYAALHCDLIRRDAITGQVEVADEYLSNVMSSHLLDQYVGAFGPCLQALDKVLTDPTAGAAVVDRARHAAAFAKADGGPRDVIEILVQLEVETVLDVGCGSGGLLMALAERRSGFHGIGIDQNSAMLDQAAARATELGLGNQFSWIAGDLLAVVGELDAATRDTVDAIVAVSVANEYFDRLKIDDFLRTLADAFPNRLLILTDYYGCLGAAPAQLNEYDDDFTRSFTHDVAQLVSGQGVPPHDVEEWRAIYDRLGCTFIQAAHGTSAGVRRFTHLVQL